MQLGLGRLTDRIRLGAKLVLLAATATTAVLAATAFLTIRLFRTQLLDVVTEANSNQSDTLRVVLEEQMTAGDLTLVRRLVNDIGRQPSIAWVAVLSHEGRVRATSDPQVLGNLIDKTSRECRICHERAPADRVRSVILLRPAGDVQRTVTPLTNRPVCHRCHGTEQSTNGLLIIDRSLAPVQKALLSSRTQVITGSAAAVLALLLSLGFAVERLVLARVRRLRAATRELGDGNLGARSFDRSSDELGDLVRGFNAMGEGLQAALARISTERQVSRTDALTGLGNARSFDEAIEQEVARIGRRPAPVSVAFFDLDHFKDVNDSRAHLAGDVLLRLVGETVRASVSRRHRRPRRRRRVRRVTPRNGSGGVPRCRRASPPPVHRQVPRCRFRGHVQHGSGDFRGCTNIGT
jgi:GGDEF domain-containing protein